MKFSAAVFYSSLRFKFLAANLFVAVPLVAIMGTSLIRQIRWSEDTRRLFLRNAQFTSRETLKQRISELRNQASLINSILQKGIKYSKDPNAPLAFARSTLEYNAAVEDFSLIEVVMRLRPGVLKRESFYLSPQFQEFNFETGDPLLHSLESRLANPAHRQKDDLQLIILRNRKLFFKIANGLYNREVSLVGMTVLTRPLGFDFCDSLKKLTGTEIVLFSRSACLDTTFFRNLGTESFSRRFESIFTRVQANRYYEETREILGIRYSLQYVPLFGMGNSPVAIIALAYPVERFLRSNTWNAVLLVGFFLLILAVYLLSSRYVLHTMLDPISVFTQAADRIARKDFSVRVPSVRSDEIGVLGRTFNNMTAALQRSEEMSRDFTLRLEAEVERKTHELSQAYDIIKQDLSVAKSIQHHILPKQLETLEGIRAWVEFQPMSEIGGDIYDLTEIKPGYFRIFLADATGHGVQAALITMLIKGEYENLKRVIDNPGELLETLNNEFCYNYNFLTMFFTCVVVDIDLNKKKLYHASAGHPMQLFISGNKLLFMETTGKCAGIFKELVYQTVEHGTIRKGDKLLLFSDGLYEEFNRSGEAFGEERIIEMIRKYTKKTDRSLKDISIKEILDYLQSQVYYHVGSGNITDDITVIGVEIPRRS